MQRAHAARRQGDRRARPTTDVLAVALPLSSMDTHAIRPVVAWQSLVRRLSAAWWTPGPLGNAKWVWLRLIWFVSMCVWVSASARGFDCACVELYLPALWMCACVISVLFYFFALACVFAYVCVSIRVCTTLTAVRSNTRRGCCCGCADLSFPNFWPRCGLPPIVPRWPSSAQLCARANSAHGVGVRASCACWRRCPDWCWCGAGVRAAAGAGARARHVALQEDRKVLPFPQRKGLRSCHKRIMWYKATP